MAYNNFNCCQQSRSSFCLQSVVPFKSSCLMWLPWDPSGPWSNYLNMLHVPLFEVALCSRLLFCKEYVEVLPLQRFNFSSILAWELCELIWSCIGEPLQLKSVSQTWHIWNDAWRKLCFSARPNVYIFIQAMRIDSCIKRPFWKFLACMCYRQSVNCFWE